MADSHPNAPGACPTSSDAMGPTNEHYNPHVLKGLGDSEAAQQAEESLTRSQMARVGRRIWRTGRRMECNHRRSWVCRIDVCDRLVCVGYSQDTAWTPSGLRMAFPFELVGQPALELLGSHFEVHGDRDCEKKCALSRQQGDVVLLILDGCFAW